MAEKKKRIGLPRLSEERKKELRLEALKKRASWTLAYQLGYYVGEQIVDRFLPTLSVDAIKTRNNISVTCAEGDECRRLDDIWYNKRISIKGSENEQSKGSEQEWNALRAHHEMLEEKYLPKTIECHFQLLNITEENMVDFKKGVGASLWNCDASHYSTKPEDIEVKADEEGWFTYVILKRD